MYFKKIKPCKIFLNLLINKILKNILQVFN